MCEYGEQDRGQDGDDRYNDEQFNESKRTLHLINSDEGHRSFGERIVKLVFDELPAQYAGDPQARLYLNHMLAEVAWAVRGFSAVRDHFQRHVQASEAHTALAQERAKGIGEQSPLRKESLAGKALSLAVGAGGATALSRMFPAIPVGWNVAAVAVLAYVVHLFLEWLQAMAVRRALRGLPREAMDSWEEEARPKYEAICRAFLEKASQIERRFYPEEPEADFEEILRRAMAFGEKGAAETNTG